MLMDVFIERRISPLPGLAVDDRTVLDREVADGKLLSFEIESELNPICTPITVPVWEGVASRT
jgi:hypothetical protein